MNYYNFTELYISEVFQGIQGEGSTTGMPCVFIRVSGCDFECTWCDTEYAQRRGNGKLRSRQHIREEVAAVTHNAYIGIPAVLTGGNPCMYGDCMGKLIQKLLRTRPVILETQGSQWQDWVNTCSHIVIAPKLQSSGMLPHTQESLPQFLNSVRQHPSVELKFVLPHDNPWAELATLDPDVWRTRLRPGSTITFQPIALPDMRTDELLTAYRAFQDIIYAGPLYAELQPDYNIRILPQLHRLVWGTQRGV